MPNIVEASSHSVIKAYEKRIQKLEEEKLLLREKISETHKPHKPLEESFRIAMEFLANPMKLWLSGRIEDKKTVMKLTFTKQLV